jgi:pSer/pThr/pTyr-binding forkhead associated (FHA) protein/Mg-chelatase subunit ChlD
MKKIIFVLIFTGVLFLGVSQSAYSQKETKTELQPLKLDILLVLDNSGSMKKNDPQFLTREVVTNFLDSLGENARLGMVIFDQEATLAEPLERVTDPKTKTEFLKSIDDVNYKGQFTNSPAAIERAVYELKTHGRKDAQKVIIFLTDGIVDSGNKTRDLERERWLKEDLTRESKKLGIRIIGIAFTNNADFSLIQTLAIKTDGEYFRAYKAEDIRGVFKNINEIINKPPSTPEVTAVKPKVKAAKPKIETTSTIPPSSQKGDLYLPLVIAGIIAIFVVTALIFVFKRKPKKNIPPETSAPEKNFIPPAELIDVNSIISDKTILLKKNKIKIGRNPDSDLDIVIPKDTVSSLHATIEYKDDYFYLEDQRSTNKTYLNSQEITANQPVKLKSGDIIKFDIFEFKFVLPDQLQAGGTRISVKEPQKSGTVLRPKKSDGLQNEHLPQPEKIKESSEKKPEDQAPDQENKTLVKPGMCPNHPARKATELCPVCKRAYCKQCMTEKDGKYMCVDCAKNLNQ